MTIDAPNIATPPADAPNPDQPSTFDDRAEAVVAWMLGEWSKIGTLITYVDQEADRADGAATAAALSAVAAGAPVWVSAGSYTAGNVRTSPVSGVAYVARTTHSGVTTDPSADATNWLAVPNIVPQTSRYDFSPGRVLTVGAGGMIGGNGATETAPGNDLSAADIEPGVYETNTSTTGRPDPADFQESIAGFGFAQVARDEDAAHILWNGSFGSGSLLRRHIWSLASPPYTFGKWRMVFDTGNAFGTLGVDGDGDPNGALMDWGSNTNGDWYRYADGRQECIHFLGVTVAGAKTWTFPAAFHAAPPALMASADVFTDGGAIYNASTTEANVRSWDFGSGTGTDADLRLLAVGRWRA